MVDDMVDTSPDSVLMIIKDTYTRKHAVFKISRALLARSLENPATQYPVIACDRKRTEGALESPTPCVSPKSAWKGRFRRNEKANATRAVAPVQTQG
jgi:hypothetical protein